jgi:DNA replication protein DnaC
MTKSVLQQEGRNGSESIKTILERIDTATVPHRDDVQSQFGPVSTTPKPACTICNGLGFIRKDVPVGHPDFGRVDFCECRKEEARRAELQKMYRMCGLDAFSDMTFDRFDITGKGAGDLVEAELRRNLLVCKDYAVSPFNHWLLLMGGYGCGKTHLAAAIAHTAVDHHIQTLLMTVPDLLDLLRSDYDEQNEERDSLSKVREIDLLILDDLGTQNSTQWAVEKLFQIINYRYIKKLATVFTTNLRIENIDGRIASRIHDLDLVTILDIQAPDYRQRPRQNAQGERSQSISALLPSSLPYLAGETFEHYDPRTKLPTVEQQMLERAYQGSRRFVDDPAGWLVFIGPSGTGKTFLAAAIANERAKKGEEPLFMLTADLLDWLRSTYDSESNVSYEDAFNVLKTTRLLVLDEYGMASQSLWANEKLYQILYHRSITKMATIITTTRPLSEIEPRFRKFFLNRNVVRVFPLEITPFLGVVMMPRNR